MNECGFCGTRFTSATFHTCPVPTEQARVASIEAEIARLWEQVAELKSALGLEDRK